MRNITIFLILTTLFTIQVSAEEPEMLVPEGNLTLQDACRLVIEKNPNVREVLMRIETARAGLVQAKSTRWPSLSANASYFTRDVIMQPDWEPTLRADVDFEEFNASANARWTLFDGFARKANILAGESQVESVEFQLQEAQRLLLEAVTATFYRAQLARENMIIATSNWEFNKELESNAAKRWEVGDAPESDMLNFSVNAIQAEVSYRAALRDFDLICTALAQLLALPNAELPTEQFPAAESELPPMPDPEFQQELEYAMAHRPDLKAMNIQIRTLEYQLKSVKGSYYPRVDVVGGVNYTYIWEDIINQEEHNAYLGLSTSFDIFSGFRRKGKSAEIRASIQAQQYAREALVLEISSGIRQRILEFEAAEDIHTKQQTAYEQSLKIRNLIEKSYLAGESSITRLNEAQTSLLNISGYLASSRIQILLSIQNLNAATGRIFDTILYEQED